jgi:RHS repeat-associated protein
VGTIVSQQEFGSWGTVRSGGVSQTTRNYTGQQLDSTGLLYYGARYYDPALGRFVSADTVGPKLEQPQSLDRYSYVLNTPLKFTDPTGRQDVDPGAPGGASLVETCAQTLSCTDDMINALSWDERIAWLERTDALYSLGGWFNNVLGILEYFRSSPTFQNSARMMFEDAHVLTVIQQGLSAALGRAGSAVGGAAAAWQDFFTKQQAGAADSDLLPRWGTAEQQGVDEAGALADSRGPTYTNQQQAVYTAFVQMGDTYRFAAIHQLYLYYIPPVCLGCPAVRWMPDPRQDRAKVRNYAQETEAAMIVACWLPWACD